MTIILGIDPGLQHTGWGIIKSVGNQLSFIAAGVIDSNSKQPLPERLRALHEGLNKCVSEYTVDEAAIEETFVNMNPSSTLKLGQARGALMLTLSLLNLPVSEYATNLVKKSVVGAGHADKNQVAMMVKVLLPSCKTLGADATDALAVAICHAHHRTIPRG